MNRLLFIALFVVIAVPGAHADSTRAEAWRARSLIGLERWSQVIRIENPKGLSGYPSSFHALVFELEDRLWIYVPGRGTQSLSLVAGSTEGDKADLARLLRAADAAFHRYTIANDGELPGSDSAKESPAISEGCFIDALAAWRTMLAGGQVPESAGILVYYGTAAGRGHAVLYYSHAGHHYVFDKAKSSQPIALQMPARPEPRMLALALLDSPWTTSTLRAKLLPLHPTSRAEQAGAASGAKT